MMRILLGVTVALVLTSLASGATNLIPNASFEDVRDGAPVGWRRVGGTEAELVVATDNPHDGKSFLKVSSKDNPKGWGARWTPIEPIPAEPGATYRLEARFRMDERDEKSGYQACYVNLYYLNAESKQMAELRGKYAHVKLGGLVPRPAWHFAQHEFTVPEGVAFFELSVHAASEFKGVVAVDSIRLLKLRKLSYTAPEGALAFDFTPAGVEPTAGFTAVPADVGYSKRVGCGWKDPRKDARPSRSWRSQGVRYLRGYPSHLDGGGVRESTFVCDLPNGKYLASIYMGSLWRLTIARMNHVASVGDRKVVDQVRSHDELMDQEYFRYTAATLVDGDDLARPGYAVWDKYIVPRFPRYDVEFEVTDGKLELKFEMGYANALVIFPTRMKAEYDKAVVEIEAMRQDDFVETWAEFKPMPPEETKYVPDATDLARGYVFFRRNWLRRVQYFARPQQGELNQPLKLFATPGEYEPVTFSMWPLRDVEGVRITAGALRNENGDIIPAEAVRVWFHQHRQQRRARPATLYTIEASFLPDWDVRDLYKGITTRCWLNVKTPVDAKPGLYKGVVTVRSKDGKPATVSIEMRVLAFKLIRPDVLRTMRRASNAVIVPYPSTYPLKEGDFRNKLFYRAEAVKDLFAHGFEPEFGPWWPLAVDRAGEKVTVAWDRDEGIEGPTGHQIQIIADLSPPGPKDLWVDACSFGPWVMPAFLREPKDGVTIEKIGQWCDELEKKLVPMGFDKIYIAAFGEESHSAPQGKKLEAFLEWGRYVSKGRESGRWPHLYSAHTCNTSWGPPLILRDFDLTGLGMFHGSGSDGEMQVAVARQSKKRYGIYGIRGRHVAGFYFWKAGATANYHEFYAPYYGMLNNDWDNEMSMDGNFRQVMNETPGWCIASYSKGGRMIGTWFWEEMREGVDDHGYMHTLEQFIKQSAGRKEPAVVRARTVAEAVLEEVSDEIDLDIDLKSSKGIVYRPIAEEEMNALRWKAAEAAEALSRAMAAK